MITSLCTTVSTGLVTGTHGQHPLHCADFVAEKPEARSAVLELWSIMESIAEAPRTLDALHNFAAALGIKFSKLRRLYYDWQGVSRRGIRRDWEVLVDRRKYPAARSSSTPPAFRAFVANLHEQHQRDTSGERVREILMAMLAAWERDPYNPSLVIPGYDEPPKRLALQGHPPGWSRSQIYRMRGNVYERTLRRQGPRAASEFLPSQYTTRVGLEFGQIIQFDDQQFDNHINVSGVNNKEMRPLGFTAIEALSASSFELALKPQLWDAKERKRSELTADEFFWFLILVLTKHGYRADIGTTLIYEHGTANPDKTGRFAERLEQITKGKVQVSLSGIWGAPAFKAMLFEGASKGNFRHKALIESSFNAVRNYHSLLRAPTGLNRDKAPEESHGLAAYNAAILKYVHSLPLEVAERLATPVTEWEDFARFARNINNVIERSRNHSLEGWAKLGFTSKMYRLSTESEHWIDEKEYLAIPAAERVALDHIVSRPGYFRAYRLSRAEVFSKHRHLLTKLPMSAVPLLAPERMWEKITVNDQLEITIKRPLLDSEPLRYIAKATTRDGHEAFLQRRKDYRILINPFDLTYIWISEIDGTYIGTVQQLYIPCDVDAEAIYNSLGELGHIKSVESKEVHTRMESTAAKRQRLVAHNKAVVDEHKAKTSRQQESKETKAADALFTAPATPTNTTAHHDTDDHDPFH